MKKVQTECKQKPWSLGEWWGMAFSKPLSTRLSLSRHKQSFKCDGSMSTGGINYRLCQILWDPNEVVLALKNRTALYSHTLKKSLIEKFLWEGAFCLNQALFAINECYWMNEKGAVQIANTFAITPRDYENRTNDGSCLWLIYYKFGRTVTPLK
jgi:hypothetical protein